MGRMACTNHLDTGAHDAWPVHMMHGRMCMHVLLGHMRPTMGPSPRSVAVIMPRPYDRSMDLYQQGAMPPGTAQDCSVLVFHVSHDHSMFLWKHRAHRAPCSRTVACSPCDRTLKSARESPISISRPSACLGGGDQCVHVVLEGEGDITTRASVTSLVWASSAAQV